MFLLHFCFVFGSVPIFFFRNSRRSDERKLQQLQHDQRIEILYKREHNNHVVETWYDVFYIWKQVILPWGDEAASRCRKQSSIFSSQSTSASIWGYSSSTAFYEDQRSYFERGYAWGMAYSYISFSRFYGYCLMGGADMNIYLR
jgi:hypothetical protein